MDDKEQNMRERASDISESPEEAGTVNDAGDPALIDEFIRGGRKRPKKKRIWLRVVLILLAVILLLVIAAALVVMHWANQKLDLMPRNITTPETLSSSELQVYYQENTDASDPEFTGLVYEPEDIVWETLPAEPLYEEANVINILLIGQDRRPGESRARSDAMILVTLNKSRKTLTLTSFMRDMYVQIPGYIDNRINVSYALGGAPLLDACLETNFGVTVDGNFEVDFGSFVSVIDMIGGVDITLTQAEANYQNNIANWDSNWEAFQGDAVAGVNRLSGSEALVYARNRTVGYSSDFGRTERQRNVLTAIVNKCKSMSVAELNALLDALLPLVSTDLSNSEIIDFAVQVIPMLSQLDIETERIPVDGGYTGAWVRSMSVLLPDLEKNRQILADIMGQNS